MRQGEGGLPPPKLARYGTLPDAHALQKRPARRQQGPAGVTDYPGRAEPLIRLSELTKTRVSRQASGVPHVWLVRLTDPALFGCAYLMASDVGTIGLSQEEVDGLRLYLKKGGFLWVDDFWGEAAWEQWSRELARAMPPSEYVIEDVPLTDPIFRSMLGVKRIPQITDRLLACRGGRRPRSAARRLRCRISGRFATRMDASSP